MPLLTSQVHVDEALSNISVAFAQEQNRFIERYTRGQI